MDDLLKTMKISASGMRSQGTRLRVISENIANADSLPTKPGEQPYQRRVVSFRSMLDRESDSQVVRVRRIGTDPAPFQRKYDPSHPAADADGYVLAPNVNAVIEISDMREAERSYEANLNLVRTARTMIQDTIDVLK